MSPGSSVKGLASVPGGLATSSRSELAHAPLSRTTRGRALREAGTDQVTTTEGAVLWPSAASASSLAGAGPFVLRSVRGHPVCLRLPDREHGHS